MRLLLAIAEAYPFAKTGGLGDVGAALPKALARRGHDVRLVLPGYPSLNGSDPVDRVEVCAGDRSEFVCLHRNGEHDGVEVWSAHHAGDFATGSPYATGDSVYAAEVEPFLVFSKTVAALAGRWRPDILHVHDWHPALAPQLVRDERAGRSRGPGATVLTIHNLAYQGRLPDNPWAPPAHAGDSVLARGIASADELSTVSAGYREEILTPEHGEGLDELLRRRSDRLRAIRNGVDYEQFDPAHDPHLDPRYDERTIERKAVHKQALQRAHGLVEDAGAPLLGMVARLVEQKGFDLLFPALRRVLGLGAQVLVAGKGEERYEQALRRAVRRWPGKVAYVPDDGEPAARRVYAGSDFFLAPSSFEPLGLAPLIALRYGAVPIVRRTGGMAETVVDELDRPGCGLGVTFGAQDAGHLVEAVRAAVALHVDTRRFRELQRRGMRAVFSWEDAARGYEQLYADALDRAARFGVAGPAPRAAAA